jgi:FkbM family methyltransferase
MRNVLIRYLNLLFSFVQGKKATQPFFKALYYFSLNGLHYGKVHSLEKDGELFQLNSIKTVLKDQHKITLFDVGGNEGHYSKKLLEIFNGKEISLHVFEPASDTFERLGKNLEGKNVFLNNFGLGDKREKRTIYKSTLGSDYASVYQSDRSDYSESIEIRKLDDYCKENEIDVIHFLKIDVEGHEYKCLRGAEKMISAQRIKIIQFEFGVSNIYSRVFFKDIFEFFYDYGYQVNRILKNGLVPVEQYHHSLEVFYTTNYLVRIKANSKS